LRISKRGEQGQGRCPDEVMASTRARGPHQFRTRNKTNGDESPTKSMKPTDIPPLITVWLQVRVLPGPPMKSDASQGFDFGFPEAPKLSPQKQFSFVLAWCVIRCQWQPRRRTVCVCDPRRISEQADVHHPPCLYHRPVADRACRTRRVLTAAPDRRRDGESASDVASQYRCRRWHSVPPTPR